MDTLPVLQQQIANEAHQILQWWMTHAVDNTHGGFVAKIDNDGVVDETAPKGSVLNCRILYAFAAAYNRYKHPQYLAMANRAFVYVEKYFSDKDNGGVYWTVDPFGKPLDTNKQLYAQAFALYGISEYCLATNSDRASQLATELYNTMEQYGHHHQYAGYGEAFTADWKPLADQRLSAKDRNEKRSMNTHLHVLEAYTNLFRVQPSPGLKQHIQSLVQLFLLYIIDPLTGHLQLFFDEEWNARSVLISYGHDIEACWLLYEAAEVINDQVLVQKLQYQTVKLANAAARGLDNDGGLWYEKDMATDTIVKQKHWWPQAEAMVGFFHAWQVTGQQVFYDRWVATWHFIKHTIKDEHNGEWFWGVDVLGQPMAGEDKAGLWKCPYHNLRACIQIDQRIERMTPVLTH